MNIADLISAGHRWYQEVDAEPNPPGDEWPVWAVVLAWVVILLIIGVALNEWRKHD